MDISVLGGPRPGRRKLTTPWNWSLTAPGRPSLYRRAQFSAHVLMPSAPGRMRREEQLVGSRLGAETWS